MPTMALMGVRMSWLMLERNSLLAWLAWMASRRALSSSAICSRVICMYLAKISISAARMMALPARVMAIH